MRNPSTRLLLLLLFLLLPGWLAGQTSTVGMVQGNVVYAGGEKDGQYAPYVQVTLEAEKTGRSPKVDFTDDDGFFKFAGIDVDLYKLYAFEAGFVSTEITGIDIQPNALREFILKLQPAEKVVEIVHVVAGRDRLETRDTSMKGAIRDDAIRRLPLRNNRVQDIIMFFPGVSRSGSSEGTDISVMGGTAVQIGYRLDGVNFTDILSGGPAGGISSSAIEQFELIRGGFQAEYGQQSTGIANIITKSGSNEVEFHYGLTWRDTEVIGASQSELDDVQAIWNMLLNAELFPLTSGKLEEGLGGLPSTREDDHDPPARFRVQHQMGVGGPIVVDKLFFYTNLDVLTSDTGSAFLDEGVQNDVITYLAKVTWNINDQNKFWAEFNIEQRDDFGFINPQLVPEATTEDTDGAWVLAAHDRHAFASDGWLEDAFVEGAFTLNHRYLTRRPTTMGADERWNIFLPPAGIVSLARNGPVQNLDYTVNDYRLTGSLTKPFKKHNVKIGAEMGYQTISGHEERFDIYNDFRLAFAEAFTDTNVRGSLGQLTSAGAPQTVSDDALLAGFYIQDLWTITDNLTIEPGLRIDWQDFVGKVLIAPRIGVSLDPTGNGQTLIQFNYGHFYQNLFLNALLWELRPSQTVSEIVPGNEATSDTVGFAAISLPDLVKASQDLEDDRLAKIFPLQTQHFDIDDRLTAPLNESWTVRLQRRLPKNIIVELAYTEAERYNSPFIDQDVIDDGEGEPGVPHSEVRVLYATTGKEEYQGWTLGVSKAFSDGWLLQASYTQQKIIGPIGAVADPLDPLSITQAYGPLDRDRTEIIQLNTSVDLPWKLGLSATYRYQTGTPITPSAFFFRTENLSNDPGNPVIVTRTRTVRPLGFNSMRLPPDRSLDVSLSRSFKFGKDNTVDTRLTIFNLTNEFNVVSGIGTFGSLRDPNPIQHPPLEPGILPLFTDIPRTVQLEFTISF